jgi:hypothetical protein
LTHGTSPGVRSTFLGCIFFRDNPPHYRKREFR